MSDHELRKLFNARNPFAALLGIEILEMSPGHGKAVMTLAPEHGNPFGTANAGALFGLAETAFGAAANGAGNVAVAVNLSISYLKPGVSGKLTAVAREVSQGGPLASYAVEISDEQGEVIVQASAMAYRRKESLRDVLKTDG